MAREPNRRSGGIFGGRGSLREGLKDTSGNQRVGLEDTWLGDFIGLDGRIGAQGASLRQSWFGARRDGPGSAANIPNTRPTERPSDLRRTGTTDDLELTYGPQNGRGGRIPPQMTTGPRSRPVIGRDGRRGTVQPDVAPQVGDTGPTMGSPSVPSESGVTLPGSDTAPTRLGLGYMPTVEDGVELKYGPQNGRGSVKPNRPGTRRGGEGINLETIPLESMSDVGVDVIREQLTPYEVTPEQWAGMSRKQREAAGLPVSTAGFDWRRADLLFGGDVNPYTGNRGTTMSGYRTAPSLMEPTPEAPYTRRTSASPTQPFDKAMAANALRQEGVSTIFDPDTGKSISIREYLDKPLDTARKNWLAGVILTTVDPSQREVLFRRNPQLADILVGEYGG